MTTRRIVTLTLALIAVAAAGNVQAKQFLKVSEVAARKAQLASGHTVPQADAIDALQQQAQAQDSGIGYGEGMIPTQSATPTADYPDLEAIQRQQEQETTALTQSIVNQRPRVVGPVPTEQIGLAGSAIAPAPAPRPVATTQPPKRAAAKPLSAAPARPHAVPKPAQGRSMAAASTAPAPEAMPATPQEAQPAESKRGLKAAEAKLRSVFSRFGRKKEAEPEPQPPTE